MERSIYTKAGKIYYWITAGSADKPTLIFLHGLSSNHKTWEEMINIFSEHGFSTIALDLRGHGFSDKARVRSLYRIPVMTNDVREILKAEQVKDYVIVGYSYGGYVGMDLASRFPNEPKGLVLISANHVSPFDYHWFSFITPIARFCVNIFGWFLIWQSRKKYYYFNPKAAQGYWRSTFTGYATMPLSINFWMLSEVFALDYRNKIKDISCPTLIIRGERDNFITERETHDMAKKIKDARVVSLGLGHYVASHYQELCAQEILKFLQ